MYLLEGEQRICSQSSFEKRNFAYTREITNNLEKHPIEQLMEESDIPCGPISLKKIEKKIKKTAILTNGYFPTRSLSFKQIDSIIRNIENEFEINPQAENWYENFDSVIGVENEHLYRAAYLGLNTTLIPTGNGENLFIKMFPNNQIKRLEG